MTIPTSLRPLAAAAFVLACAGAQAARYDAPVADNAYITANGLDWAWANPVAADGSFVEYSAPTLYTGIDLGYQAQFGWRLATAEELAFAPLPSQFLFEGANVPGEPGAKDPVSGSWVNTPGRNGVDMACAAAYFSAWATTCNYANGPGLSVEGYASVPWWGQPGAQTWSDTLVVRVATPVPEPATVALMFAGLGIVAVARRKRG